MSGTLTFVKMSGTGNDFVLIDNRTSLIPEEAKAGLAARLCDRRRSVGGDGLILLERPSESDGLDVRMRIFNSDGSEAEMCGNGARCLAHFALATGAAGAEMRIQTMAGAVGAQVTGDRVVVDLTRPGPISLHEAVSFDSRQEDVYFVDTGVPHAVVFVDDIEAVDVRGWGRQLRYHELFRPAGANVNFVSPTGAGGIAVRTYERGVEDETLACGTGSTASALVSAHTGTASSPVAVTVRSGEDLAVHFSGVGPQFDSASLEGDVSVSFRGEADWDAPGA